MSVITPIPAWHMRGMIRDMLFYHARQFVEPAMRVRQARNLLDFLAKTSSRENTPYGLLLKQELEAFHRSSDSYLFHQHLEEHNEPVYFHEFAERAARAGLRYLAEVDLRVMVPANYPPEIANVLHMLAQDHIHLEQYMDFLRNRMFRQTLLCHDHVKPNYNLRWQQLKAFHVGSPARACAAAPVSREEGEAGGGAGPFTPAPSSPSTGAREASDAAGNFETPDGVVVHAGEPIVRGALEVLGEAWPRAVPFGELVDEARKRLTSAAPRADDEESVGQALLSFYAQAGPSLVELWLEPPRFAAQVSEKPMASALARLQAETRARVTNLRHESVYLGDFERRMLRLTDGTRTRLDLAQDLMAIVATGELTVEKDGAPLRDPGRLRESVLGAVDAQLTSFARGALLLA